MPRVLLIVALVALIVYALVDASQADAQRMRLMPKWLWLVTIIALPGVGAAAYLFLGRPTGGQVPPGPQRRPIAPDDDPDFLRGL